MSVIYFRSLNFVKFMFKKNIVLFILLVISSCVIKKDLGPVSNTNSNTTNKLSKVIQPYDINKNNNDLTSAEKLNNIEFVEWKCRKYFGFNKILKVGYFPRTLKNEISLGAIILETNKKINPAIHKIEGIDDTFSWGGKNLITYKIVIKANNTAYYFDFTNSKGKNIDYKHILKCSKTKYILTKKEVGDYFSVFKKFSKKLNLDFPIFY